MLKEEYTFASCSEHLSLRAMVQTRKPENKKNVNLRWLISVDVQKIL